MTSRDDHSDWNDLAALAERGPDAVAPAVLQHLAVCPDCLAAYGEAVRVLDAPPALAPVVPLRPHRRRRPVLVAAAVVAAAAVLALALLPRAPDGYAPGDPRAELLARLTALSATGPVYPGIDAPAENGARYRAAADADADLTPWQDRFAADPADSDAAYWLAAGHLAAGRLRFADDVLRRARRHHPDAVGLRHLEAIAAYRMSELERAEAALAGLLAVRPGDETAVFNRALILIETGRGAEARRLLEPLAAGHGSGVLQDRARALLAGIAD